MKKKKTRKIIVLLFLLSLFTVLETGRLMEMGKYYGLQKKTITDTDYRRDFFSSSMREKEELLSDECIT